MIIFLLLVSLFCSTSNGRRERKLTLYEFIHLTQETALSIVAAKFNRSGKVSLLQASAAAREQQRYATCAVVGNSGILLDAGHGAAIDRAERVIRFNWPPIAGFERDVGRKTTVMLCGNTHTLESSYGPWTVDDFDADLQVYFRLHHYDYTRARLEHALQLLWRAHNERLAQAKRRLNVNLFSPRFEREMARWLVEFAQSVHGPDRELNEIGEPYKPTSGFRGVMLALLTCERVDVYGFGTHKVYGNGHYFATERVPILENVGHNYSIERDVMFAIADADRPSARKEACDRHFSGIWPRVACGTLVMHTENSVPWEPRETIVNGTTRRQQQLARKLAEQAARENGTHKEWLAQRRLEKHKERQQNRAAAVLAAVARQEKKN